MTRHVHDRISLRGFIMKILEVRDGFIKFESNKNFALASFLQITSLEKNYVGQVIQVRRGDDCFIIYAKLLYNFDGNLQNYDGTLPRRNVEIVEISENVMKKISTTQTPQKIAGVAKYFEDINDGYNGNVVALDGVQDPGNASPRRRIRCGTPDGGKRGVGR